MSGGFQVQIDALESCRQVVADQAGQFGGIGDDLSTAPAGGSSFGSMPASGRVSQLSTQLSAAAASQFSSAEAFLRAAERAIDQVQENYSKAERVNAANARSA
jgi:hypothetical protein